MKKISLSKETLRVLTAQETDHVGGGQIPQPQTVNNACQPISQNTCLLTACSPNACNPETLMNGMCVPETRRGPRCVAEPISQGRGCDPNF